MKPYYVFTSYPDRPVCKCCKSSNNLPTIGFSASDSKIKELCREYYPDMFYISKHATRKDAKRFVNTLIRGQSNNEVFINYGELA